ncbi:GNAT family N-acetyltransferase [Aestuariivirga litoralis]|uniref:GNAT family N-acetyltransferase n=1 Tax=Aestuariivirga litoralis TaxID=2650924 RepID=UPI0018C6E3A4|nr:GNAT family N-acetyltransferase [Aestuariivirga litoralis]MBG1233532.1 GNAT family N-acetyltransferase [Aestuariivirga litoralis]
MELETRRLLLRPLRDDDALAMVQALNNINVSRNLAKVPFPYTLADAEGFIKAQRSFDPRSEVCAIAFKAAPDELIGVVSYVYGADARVEFGYWLRECCWHMGLMSEAAFALVHHAFTAGGVEALHAGYHADNLRSGRVLRGLGFEEIGSYAAFGLAQNKHVPAMRLRLTAASWFTQKEGRAA